MKYSEIAAINVNEHVEKKNNLSYLSWAWAVDQLLRLDNEANWSFGEPKIYGSTMMVFCTVTAFGRARTCQLPVMDYKNKAIPNPDAFAVNTAMLRCLVKAISLTGLGLYIYAGEDMPPEDDAKEEITPAVIPVQETGEAGAVDFIVNFATEFISDIKSVAALRDFWKQNKSEMERVKAFSKPQYLQLEELFKSKAKELT